MSRSIVFSFVFRTVLSSALFALVPIRFTLDDLEPLSAFVLLLAGTDQAVRARTAFFALSDRYGTTLASLYVASLCSYGMMLGLCTFGHPEMSLHTVSFQLGVLLTVGYSAYVMHRSEIRRLRCHYVSGAVQSLAATMKASQEIVKIAQDWTDIDLIRCYMTTMDEETLEELMERLSMEDVLRFMYSLVKEEQDKFSAKMEELTGQIARAAE